MLVLARQIFRFRDLLFSLIGRELKARYRGSLLGFFWSLVNPALLLAVYTFVFGIVFRPRVEAAGTSPYALFLVTGLFPWIWVSSSLLEGTVGLVQNAGLLRKAVFPAALLPLVAVGSHLVHFLLALPILGVALVGGRLLGHPVGGWSAVLLPIIVVLEIPLIAGLALGLAALEAHFKDVRDILSNLLTLLFFLTPIIYPLAAVTYKPLWWLVRLNPFTPFTLAYQQALFEGLWPSLNLWLQMIGCAAVGWAIGAWIFARLQDTLVEAV
jgi:ABC-type polysaccharide/polyol phosphate export permease